MLTSLRCPRSRPTARSSASRTRSVAAEPGFWEQQGWIPDAPVQTMARIDTPTDGATVAATETTMGGVAFAADRGIQRVEVSTDGGSSWAEAELLPSLGPSTWTFW